MRAVEERALLRRLDVVEATFKENLLPEASDAHLRAVVAIHMGRGDAAAYELGAPQELAARREALLWEALKARERRFFGRLYEKRSRPETISAWIVSYLPSEDVPSGLIQELHELAVAPRRDVRRAVRFELVALRTDDAFELRQSFETLLNNWAMTPIHEGDISDSAEFQRAMRAHQFRYRYEPILDYQERRRARARFPRPWEQPDFLPPAPWARTSGLRDSLDPSPPRLSELLVERLARDPRAQRRFQRLATRAPASARAQGREEPDARRSRH